MTRSNPAKALNGVRSDHIYDLYNKRVRHGERADSMQHDTTKAAGYLDKRVVLTAVSRSLITILTQPTK
jgi:hypothetical protein